MSNSEIVDALNEMLSRVMAYPLLTPEEEAAVEAAVEKLEGF